MQIRIFKDSQPQTKHGSPGELLFAGETGYLLLGTQVGYLNLPERVSAEIRELGEDHLVYLTFPPEAKIVRLSYAETPLLRISWAVNEGSQVFSAESQLKVWALGLTVDKRRRLFRRFSTLTDGPFYIILE
jgi:hypothetical protein